ncbi:5329_t:CDS:2 [Diversispora eburnea]|uniref:5329_t:CDS:1 n=1 Tax=Diversispora eburnea TaxID=1213867 RepID=A0A9N9F8A4_9GLOM|nr:5329_t:CDS:2 [Diversispora eburnea]
METTFFSDMAEDFKQLFETMEDLREYDGPEILKILIASDELGLQKLIDFIQKFLIDNRDDFLRQDPVGMLYIITRHLGFGSLKNDKNNISGATIGRISPSYYNYAVYCHSSYGPTFGAGKDLRCYDGTNNWRYSPSSYNNISLPSSFTVSDWEVFKVVTKA